MANMNLFRSWLGKMIPPADILNEAGGPAYQRKPASAVMHAQRDLVEVVYTLRQVICVKG